MKNYHLSLIVASLSVMQPVFSQNYTGRIGVNFGDPEYVDIVKQTNRVNYIGGQGPLADSSFDANLWPKCDFNIIWDWRPIAEWGGTIDDPEKYRIDHSGVYKGSFNGLVDSLLPCEPNGYEKWTIQNKKYDTATNKTTFELVMPAPGPHHGLIWMKFVNTRRTLASAVSSGITNFKFIRPGYDTASTQVFINEIYAGLNLAGFSTIRAMSLTGTAHEMLKVYPDTTGWNSRKTLSVPFWGGKIGKYAEAAPWEVFIDLCNQADMNMWINIPISATEDYMVQLAKLIKTRLNSNLNVYIENDNEVWGFANPKSYNEAEATAKTITPARNYARRAYVAAKAFEKVFGAGSLNNRIKVGLMWWFASDINNMLDYLNTTYGDPSQYIYSMSGGGYFSNDLMTGKTPASVEDIVVSSYFGTTIGDVFSGSDTNALHSASGVAKKWKIKLTSYESSPAMCNPLNPNILTAPNCIAAYRDSCMAASLRRHYEIMLGDFDVQLTNFFTLGSKYSRYGCWGLTDDIRKPYRTSLFKTIQELLGELSSPKPPRDLKALKKPDNRYFLQWTDQASDETGFIIERKDTGGKYIFVKQIGADTTTYWDSVTYYKPKYYRVKALNANGTSTYANLAFVIDSTPPPKPTGFIAYDISKTSLKLKWDKPDYGEIQAFWVYQDNKLIDVTKDTFKYVIALKCGTTYKFNVKLLSTSSITSPISDTLTVSTLPCWGIGIDGEENVINVYPNPATDKIWIDIQDEIKGSVIEIVDMVGNVVNCKRLNEQEQDISGLSNGIYLIRIITSDKVFISRFVKQ